jgi:hypothetical protein
MEEESTVSGKVFILRDIDDSFMNSIGPQQLGELARLLGGTIVRLPVKYDFDKLDLDQMKQLVVIIQKEITRKELLNKLGELNNETILHS